MYIKGASVMLTPYLSYISALIKKTAAELAFLFPKKWGAQLFATD